MGQFVGSVDKSVSVKYISRNQPIAKKTEKEGRGEGIKEGEVRKGAEQREQDKKVRLYNCKQSITETNHKHQDATNNQLRAGKHTCSIQQSVMRHEARWCLHDVFGFNKAAAAARCSVH